MQKLFRRGCGRGALALLVLGCAVARGQEPAPQHPKTGQPAVGASEIFDALAEPDRPAELEALRNLRANLVQDDPKSLQTARDQLDALLQREEHKPGDMPPALVMSGIATRIDNAIAALEDARRLPRVAAAPTQPVWLLPALGGVGAILATALLLALAALVLRGRATDEAEEMRSAISKLRQKLEAPAAAGGLARDNAEAAAEEASAAAHDTAIAANRLVTASREAETRLTGCVANVEARLLAAISKGSQVEEWANWLPGRLAEMADGMEAHSLQMLESMASVAAGCGKAITEAAASLPGIQREFGESAAGLATSSANCAAALVELVDGLVASLPDKIAGAIEGPIKELANCAETVEELSKLAIGQTEKLESLISRAEELSADLPRLSRGLESAAVDIRHEAAMNAEASGASRAAIRAAKTLCSDIEALTEALPGRLAAAAQAAEIQTEAALGAAAAADLRGMLATQTERLATLLDGVEQVAAKLGQAAAATAFVGLQPCPQPSGADGDRTEALHGLETAIRAVQDVTAMLQSGAEAQEQAVTQVARAAAAISAAAMPALSALPASHPKMPLARLSGLVTEAESLQREAETLAAAALRGEAAATTLDLALDAPDLLVAIQTSIHRLNGTATALALASDARRRAA